MAYLTREPINVTEWHQGAADGRDGASVEFLGIVRSEENDQRVNYLAYEAYEPMAERLLAQLVSEAEARWPLHQVCVRHRLGKVPVGEIAILVGVTAPHREEAFEACRFLIDAIKRDVPIWKTADDANEDVMEGCDVGKDRCD